MLTRTVVVIRLIPILINTNEEHVSFSFRQKNSHLTTTLSLLQRDFSAILPRPEKLEEASRLTLTNNLHLILLHQQPVHCLTNVSRRCVVFHLALAITHSTVWTSKNRRHHPPIKLSRGAQLVVLCRPLKLTAISDNHHIIARSRVWVV